MYVDTLTLFNNSRSLTFVSATKNMLVSRDPVALSSMMSYRICQLKHGWLNLSPSQLIDIVIDPLCDNVDMCVSMLVRANKTVADL